MNRMGELKREKGVKGQDSEYSKCGLTDRLVSRRTIRWAIIGKERTGRRRGGRGERDYMRRDKRSFFMLPL